ncbi:hypothetical protein pb186bvf_015170 [Paramecium bursaria]
MYILSFLLYIKTTYLKYILIIYEQSKHMYYQSQPLFGLF